jgi:hypothetical protein
MVMLLQGPSGIPPEVVMMANSFFTMVAVIALGIPIVRIISKRWDRPALPPSNTPSSEVVSRLERIEQAVEAVAIEVERIAEAQRFSAKLMAEQQQQRIEFAAKLAVEKQNRLEQPKE